MSEPRRLLTGEASEFERSLLGAWQRRQPSAEARMRALSLGGAGVGVALATGAGASAAKAATTSVAPKAVTASLGLMKWVGIAVVGATATAGVAVMAGARHAERAPTPLVSQGEPVAASPLTSPLPARGAAPALPAPVSPAADTPSDPVSAIELAPDEAPGARPRAPAPAAARPSTLDDEVSMVDQARRALAAGDGAAALSVLGAYDAKYPGGSLSQESTALRVEALVASGNRALADRLGSRFIASHPSSPYVHRVRALLADPKP